MMTYPQDVSLHPLTSPFHFSPMPTFKPSLEQFQALQQLFSTLNQSTQLAQQFSGNSTQNLTSPKCTNEYCSISTSQTKTAANQKLIVDQARSLGVNVVCVNCGNHDFGQLLQRVLQDGEPFLLINSNKLGQTSYENTNPSQAQGSSFSTAQQSSYQINTYNNNPVNIPSDSLSPSFISTVSPIVAPSSSTSSSSSLSTASLHFNQPSFATKPFNTNPLPIPLFPYSDIFYNSINQPQQQPMQQQQQIQQQQQQNMQTATSLNTPFNNNNHNNSLLQHALQAPQFTLTQLFGEQNIKINLPPTQNSTLSFPLGSLQPNGEDVQSLLKNPIIAKPIELQQEDEGDDQEDKEPYPSTKRISVASAASKQKHGLFKKRHSNCGNNNNNNKSQKEIKVKLEGDGSGSTSQNNSLSDLIENDSNDSFSDGCNVVDQKQTARRSTETNTQMTPAELEKQNKIRERRKTNNFGHIYTWLKNQIRLYYGDRGLYETIQSYFTRVNKYNEVVTDESSSKWQYFLFQIKDNTSLKEFLKEKIKSEHFKEYIKTRKGKDQRVFYEFRIGVIYGIDHPELSNQPKNCLLMAKKDPEYTSIVFGW